MKEKVLSTSTDLSGSVLSVILAAITRRVPPIIGARIFLLLLALASVFILAIVSPTSARLFRRMSDGETGPGIVSEPSAEADTSNVVSEPVSLVPVIRDVVEIEASNMFTNQDDGGLMLFGTFILDNPRKSNFVLQLSFANGGELTSDEDARRVDRGRPIKRIGLRDLELRYKDDLSRDIVKKLSSEDYRGGNGVFEVKFLLEDVQELYEMELWGALRGEDIRAGRGGFFRGEVKMGIEIIP